MILRLIPPIKIHCWGGLGSQLYALALAIDLKHRFYTRKIDTKTHQFNIIKRVEGKQGRMLFFNGKHYHTATQPKEKYKCVININVA